MKSASRYLFATWLVAALALTIGTVASADETEWIADKRGCKVANPFPRAGESITWSGPCKNGFADGQGILQWFFNGKEDDQHPISDLYLLAEHGTPKDLRIIAGAGHMGRKRGESNDPVVDIVTRWLKEKLS